MKRSKFSLVVTALLSATLSLGFVGAAGAAPGASPIEGQSCSSDEAGRIVDAGKGQPSNVVLMCSPVSDGGPDHVPAEGGKQKGDKSDWESLEDYRWRYFAYPDASVKPDLRYTGVDESELLELVGKQYRMKSADPCRVNSRPVSRLVSYSYGEPGLYGRQSYGFADSFGTVKVGVVAVVPSNYEVVDDGAAFRAAGSNAAGVPVAGLTHFFRSRIAEYLTDYFLEQSYGQLNLEFAYAPTVHQSEFSVADWSVEEDSLGMTRQTYDATQAVKAIPESWWRSDGAGVDMLLALELDKPGPFFWWNPAEREGDALELVSRVATPGGRFSGIVTIPSRLTTSDQPLVAHEIGHALRLPDMYQDSENPVAVRGAARIGRLASGYTSSGMLGWSRYISRWITDAQIECIPSSLARKSRVTKEVTLTSLQRHGRGKDKSLAVIPLATAGKALVVESWRPVGSDAATPSPQYDGTGANGALVYVIDTDVRSGLQMQGQWPFPGNPATLYRDDARTVLPGAAASLPAACSRPEALTGEECKVALTTQIRSHAFLRPPSTGIERQPQTRARYDFPVPGVCRDASGRTDGEQSVTVDITDRGKFEDTVSISIDPPRC